MTTGECGTAHFYLARDCVQVFEPTSDDLEETKVIIMSPSEMQRALRDGEVLEMCTATALGLASMEMNNNDNK